MKRFLLVPLVGVLAALGLGSAAALGDINTPDIAASEAPVGSCDTQDGVDVSYTVIFDGEYKVGAVNVSSIDVPCDGETLSVTLTNFGTGVGTATATISGTDETVTFALPVPVANINDIHVAIY